MLETVDLSVKVDKKKYEKVFPELELRLSELQRKAKDANVAVMITVDGWEGSGKGSTIKKLTEVLDPRGYRVHRVSEPEKQEREHPYLWRFWTKLPPRGRIAIFDHSWYRRVLVERVDKLAAKKEWKRAYEEINEFEKTLADDGMVFIKFWFHLTKKQQKKRIKSYEKDPILKWLVTKDDWRENRMYDKYRDVVEEMLERTHSAHAPWTVVEAMDKHHALIKVYETVIQTVEKKLEAVEKAKVVSGKVSGKKQKEVKTGAKKSGDILGKLNLKLALTRKEYDRELVRWQSRLRELQRDIKKKDLAVVIVYEGMDAAGKGGNIKRLTDSLDPRGYTVVPVAAPTTEEKAHNYLWRFWTKLPHTDHITIYDRSWYGRVLVERVEGFCSEEEWRRAYQEINAFEKHLADWGTVLVKFWVHIDLNEQLKRFKERQKNPLKTFKITPEDWRNREKAPHYITAANDMIENTGTKYAPWTVIEGNCKWWARIKALRTAAKAIEKCL